MGEETSISPPPNPDWQSSGRETGEKFGKREGVLERKEDMENTSWMYQKFYYFSELAILIVLTVLGTLSPHTPGAVLVISAVIKFLSWRLKPLKMIANDNSIKLTVSSERTFISKKHKLQMTLMLQLYLMTSYLGYMKLFVFILLFGFCFPLSCFLLPIFFQSLDLKCLITSHWRKTKHPFL